MAAWQLDGKVKILKAYGALGAVVLTSFLVHEELDHIATHG